MFSFKNENLKVIKKIKKSINKNNTTQTIENTKFVQCLDFENIENEELQN